MMGYIYSQFGQEVYALNIYVSLNVIMSFRLDYKQKLKLTMEMGKIMSKLKKHGKSIELFKQSLSFAWYTKDKETEIQLYEYLGLEYYNMMEIEKASYYHNRSIDYEWEDEGSISFINSINFINKCNEQYQSQSYRYQQINHNILDKLNLHYDPNYNWNTHSLSPRSPKTNPKHNKRRNVIFSQNHTQSYLIDNNYV